MMHLNALHLDLIMLYIEYISEVNFSLTVIETYLFQHFYTIQN